MITPKLKQLMDELVQKENFIELLKEANQHMKQMRERVRLADKGETDSILRHVLPKDHKIIAPLVEAYYDDLHGWYVFLKTMRDESGWSDKDVKWRKIHQMMRDAHSNYSQNARRTLAGLATDYLEATRGKLKRGQRTVYMNWVKKCWTAERAKLEDQLRASHPGDHLPNDLRQDHIDAFWEKVKTDLEAGKIPPVPEGFDD